MRNTRFQSICTRFSLMLLGIMVLVTSVGVQEVSAGMAVTNPTSDALKAALFAKETAKETQKEVKSRVKEVILATGLSGLMNAASYFMRKVAYDAAKYVASGGKGQSALVFESGFGEYLKSTADDAVGEIINDFSALTGLNLCSIPDPEFNLFIKIGIRGIYSDGAPTASGCSWTELRNNWSRDAMQERFERYGDQLGQTLDSYTTGEFLRGNVVEQSDFGIALGAIGQIDRIRAEQREGNLLDRLEGGGFQGVTDYISGNIRTPAAVVAEETKAATAKGNTDLTASQIAGIYGTASLQILPQAASIFLNTLVSDLLQQVMTRGLVPKSGSTESLATDPFAGPAADRRRAAEQVFNFLFTSIPLRQLNSYDTELVNQFATCPEYPGVYNCVIDSGLQQALDRARIGAALTIREAMEAQPPLLNPNWPLIPPERAQDNQSRDCYLGKYCYSNIQKLRKARILPLGFEIATTLGDPDNPSAVTLGQVVSGFNDCAIGQNGQKIRDAAHPYCNLIDPNWIIKMPEAICEAVVHSPILVAPQVADRQQECADLATCTAYDASGQCISYGYCLQEENSWQMPGQSCPAEYATCRSYIQQSNGAAVSYLHRTVDVGMCGPDNIGCLAYSTVKDTSGNWVPSITTSVVLPRNTTAANTTPTNLNTLKQTQGINQALHLNNRIHQPEFTCSASDAGCTQLRVANIELGRDPLNPTREIVLSATPAGGDDIALRLAPNYLTCYDRDLDIANGVQWPTTAAEAITAYNSNAACSNFAPVCTASEVGCKLWEPVNGGASVPGKIGANSCALECVGYDTFRQLETIFEPEIDPLHFIPSQAEVCQAQYVGCSEFTNIAGLAQGGEEVHYFTEIRYCELPNNDNEKNFYSWEGSEVEGYVLRVHRLAQYTETDPDKLYYDTLVYGGVSLSEDITYELFRIGAPKYAERTKAGLAALYAGCNEDSYNLRIADPFDDNAASVSCREFYDDAGNKYYREIDNIVSVSNSCTDFRKTDTNLSVDSDITDSDTCTTRGGLWQGDEGGECHVCRGGGIYNTDGNYCVYATIVSESRQCPASQNQCRAYVGNTGENIRRLTLGMFEGSSTDTEGWTGASISVSTESPFANQQSLRVAGTASKQIAPNELQTGTTEAAYELRFWARGVPQQVSARFNAVVNAPIQAFGSVAIGDTWRAFVLGPISASDLNLTTTNTLQISGQESNQFFIDNVELVRTSAYTYLRKNSWQRTVMLGDEITTLDVPLACDSTPRDAFPGEALGCSLYRNANNPADQQAVVGFESLCRSEAIGCTAVYNTQNTTSGGAEAELEQWYNARCERGTNNVSHSSIDVIVRPGGADAGTCTVYGFSAIPVSEDNKIELGSCTIRQGDSHCYIDRIVIPESMSTPLRTLLYNNLANTASTYIVPADTPEIEPIFVSNQREYQCRSVGCTELGQQLQTMADPNSASSYEFNTVYYRLRPERFTRDETAGREPVLCTGDGVGCDAFQSSGNLQYFKDPLVTGNSLCEYRDNVRVGTETRSGWFQRGVGYCSGTTNICSTDDQCAGTATCNTNEPVPCYDNYITSDNVYGIWSAGTQPNYQGFVGACAPQHNACTEFIDRADTSLANGEGSRYYAILNDQLTGRTDECNGEVGLKDGCVLFDQTDNPNKYYNTAATYAASENNTQDKYGLVAPVTTPTGNNAATIDANIILKVNRDRQCAEWLECRLSRPETDENGQVQDVCIMYDVCLEADPSGGCAMWSDTVGAGYCSADPTRSCWDAAECGVGTCVFQSTLTVSSYTSRDTSWYGRDYAGYSVLGNQPYGNMEPIVFPHDPYKQYLATIIPEQVFTLAEAPERGCTNANPAVTSGAELQSCGLSNEGVCYTGRCIAPIQGSLASAGIVEATDANSDGTFNVTDRMHAINAPKYVALMNSLIAASCKAPPEADAPYPATVLARILTEGRKINDKFQRYAYELPSVGNRKSGFVGAQIYQDPFHISTLLDTWDHPYVSSCVYTKVTYDSGTTDFFPINVQTPKGVLVADNLGAKQGTPCNPTEDPLDPNYDPLCSKTTSIQTHIGMDGFCLQKDISRPINGGDDYACLVWLPMQLSASRIDVYNDHVEAGYYPVPAYDAPPVTSGGSDSGGVLYCMESTDVGGIYVTDDYDGNIDRDVQGQKVGFCVSNTAIESGNVKPARDRITGVCFHNNATWSKCVDSNSECYEITNDYDPCISPDSCSNDDEEIGDDDDELSICGVTAFPHPSQDNQGEPWPSNTVEHCQEVGQNELTEQTQWGNNYSTVSTIERRCEFAAFSSGDGKPIFACKTGNNKNPSPWVRASERSMCHLSDGADRKNTEQGIYQKVVCGANPDLLYSWIQMWVTDSVNTTKLHHAKAVHVLRIESPYSSDGVQEESITWGQGKRVLFPTREKRTQIHQKTENAFTGVSKVTQNQQVYSTGLEAHISKQMIERVYFIPLRIPMGFSPHEDNVKEGAATGQRSSVPPPMTTAFFIDLTQEYYKNDRAPGSVTVANQDVKEKNRYYNLEFPDAISDMAVHVAYRQTDGLPEGVGSRYVATYGTTDLGITEAKAAGTAINNLPCDDNNRLWFAVAMDFKPDGAFLRYHTAQCNNAEKPSGRRAHEAIGLQVAVVASLQDICIDLVQVYDEGKMFTGTTNKAWTNKVWSGADEAFTLITGTSPNQQQLKQDTAAAPYGSIPSQDVSLLDNSLSGGPLSYGGVPWRCAGDLIPNSSIYRKVKPSPPCSAIDPPRMQLFNSGTKPIRSLETYFAQSFGRTAILGADTGSNHQAGGPTFYYDNSRTIGSPANLLPPQIYATNPVTCGVRSSRAATLLGSTNAGTTTPCSPGPANTFTINGMTGSTSTDYNADGIPDEDMDGDGEWDGLLGYGTYPITLQFFAFADHNRMPIRTVKIDFNDGMSPIGNQEGYYKNAKPYCAPSIGECGTSQLTCTTNKDCTDAGFTTGPNSACSTEQTNFGNQERACTQNYFEYNYVYRCYGADTDGTYKVQVQNIPNQHIQERILRYPGITSTSYVCAYKPKVQVTDNWGWCNGSNQNSATGAWDVSRVEGRYDTDCDDTIGSAWTPYAQTVYVVPRVSN